MEIVDGYGVRNGLIGGEWRGFLSRRYLLLPKQEIATSPQQLREIILNKGI